MKIDVSGEDLKFDKKYWLEISINGDLVSKRVELATSPYSIYSKYADTSKYSENIPPISLQDLDDVELGDTQNNSVLVYRTENQKWESQLININNEALLDAINE